MNRQINYIIQGFLLALLLPTAGFIINKFSSAESVNEVSSVIDYEELKKPDVAIGISYKGKNLFLQKCAACHHVFKEGTGPSLMDFQERGPWADRQNLYSWIKNPSAFMKKDAYTKALKEKYGSVMTAFPDISNEEIDLIAEYINKSGRPVLN